jgi:hypothetical protein
MNKIKIEQPLWATVLIVIIAALTLLLFGDMFFNLRGFSPWMDKFLKSLGNILILFVGVGSIACQRYYHRVWLRIKQANGQECPGCQYPGTVKVGGKCTECGMDFTPEIVRCWRKWWSAERLPRNLPSIQSGQPRWVRLLKSPIRVRHLRFYSSRSKPTPTPPTPDALPPPQPDPLASKTDA